MCKTCNWAMWDVPGQRPPLPLRKLRLPGVHCETGIVFLPRRPFALSVMSTYLRPNANPLPEAVSLVYAYFESLAGANRYGHKVE